MEPDTALQFAQNCLADHNGDSDGFACPLSAVSTKGSCNINTRVRKDVKRPVSKPRLWQKDTLRYIWTMTHHGWMTSEIACEEIENALALSATGQASWKPFKRLDGLKYRGKGAETKADLMCPFSLESACPFKMRRVRRVSTHGKYEYCLHVGDQQHSDHTLRVDLMGEERVREHLSLAVQAKINSPSKIKGNPRNLVDNLCRGGFVLPSKNEAGVKDQRLRFKS